MPRRQLWVVEHYCDHRKQWSATVGVKLTRDEARDELRDWKQRNPDDRFRLVPYEATR